MDELCGYSFLKELGKGGFATTYSVLDVNGKKKAFKYSDLNSNSIEFLAEVDVLFRLRHPNLIEGVNLVLPTDCNIDGYGIVMPLAANTVAGMLRSVNYTIEQRIKHLFEVCCGLAFMHQNGIAHLDVKPENVLIMNDNTAKLADFGICKYVDNIKIGEYSNMKTGTIQYSPPEFFAFGYVKGGAVDVWSLGMMFVSVLGREPPINSLKDLNILKDDSRFDNISRMFSGTSTTIKDKVIALTNDMLRFNPNERSNMNAVLSSNLFGNYKVKGGQVYQPPIRSIDDSILDTILNISNNIPDGARLETLFLAYDLAYRCHSVSSDYTDIINIAYKLVEDSFYTKSKGSELVIIKALDGIMYRHNLYTYASTVDQLLKGYQIVLQPRLYIKTNMETWTNDGKGESKDAMTVSGFFSLLKTKSMI